jgi:deoxyribonuclease IV
VRRDPESTKERSLRIGAHLPVADGYPATLAYALELGCEAMQIIAKSPRMWSAPPVDAMAASAFAAARADAGIVPCVIHAAYLINLGTADDDLWGKSVAALADELRRAAVLHADGVVVHMGTAPAGPGAAAVRVADGVGRAWSAAASALGTDAPPVLLENSAGAGHSFGRDVAEIAATVAAVRAHGVDAVGVCIDTCHAFAAGIDLRCAGHWDDFASDFDERIGLERLRVVHANDCAGGLGERRDRHAWIGDGEIGERGFEAMFAEARLAHVAAIMEMPGERPVKDVENLARLRRLRVSASAP